jgi:hypothetical protein
MTDEQHRWIYSHITEVSVDNAGQVSQAKSRGLIESLGHQ